MSRHTKWLQFEALPERPDALYARKLQAVKDPVMAAVIGGMDPQQAIVGGGGAMPNDSKGVPWNRRHIIASGNLLADFRADAAAEAHGRLQTARLYNMTDDPGVKSMLQFNLARDTADPIAGPATAPPPDPALFGTYSAMQDAKGTMKSKAQAAVKNITE